MACGWLRVASLAAAVVTAACPVWSEEGPAEPAQRFRYDAKGRRDPFSPLVVEGRLVGEIQGASDASKPVLSGILWDAAGASIALINETEVRVGDTVNDYEVIEIRKDTVVLDRGGQPMVLEIAYETLPALSSDATTGGKRR